MLQKDEEISCRRYYFEKACIVLTEEEKTNIKGKRVVVIEDGPDT
jgi:predicted GTPase